jgi:hypothetical protein
MGSNHHHATSMGNKYEQKLNWIPIRMTDLAAYGFTIKELYFVGVATTKGASGDDKPVNASCMNLLSTIDSSLFTNL